MPTKSLKSNLKTKYPTKLEIYKPWYQNTRFKFVFFSFIILILSVLFFNFSLSNHFSKDQIENEYKILTDFFQAKPLELRKLLSGASKETGKANYHKEFLKIVNIYPESIQALYGLYMATNFLGEYEECLLILEKLKKMLPRNQIIEEGIQYTKKNIISELTYCKKLEDFFYPTKNEKFLTPNLDFETIPNFSSDLEQKIHSIHDAIKKIKESEGFETFSIKSRRLYGIETGLIEGLYLLTKEITRQLIELGISSEIIFHDDNQNHLSELERMQKAIEISEIIHDNIEAFLEIDRIIYENREISIDLIKNLHKVFTSNARYFHHPKEGMKLLRRGKFKLRPNTVYDPKTSKYLLFAAPSIVERKMNELLMNLLSRIKMNEEVFGIASWLHCVFIGIHPFDDGNGRVARALASILLGKAGFLPFTVSPEMKEEYYYAVKEFLVNKDYLLMVNLMVKQQEYVINQYEQYQKIER